jgi:O-antigen biosynthesis protein
MFWTPERQAPSAWIEHVPFAFWLVDVLRPRRIVELGTHHGVSYSAMCQAVKSLGLATSCFAIDTWKGDDHAGFYGEDVYRDFAAFHDQRYGAFSQLVRSSFDEALRHFEEASIDLLHIDGLHTYEAVRHDYQSWLPKLAANAVVLFHDTNVREREFGVVRLWSEITVEKLHFNFLHGHGLGVLGHGWDYSDPLRFLIAATGNRRLVSSVRETFGALGRSVRTLSESPGLDKALSERTSEISSLRQSLAAREDELTAAKQGLTERTSEISSLRQSLAAREDELTAAKQGLAERTSEISSLRQSLAAREDEVTAAKQGLAERTGEISSLRQSLAARDRQIEELHGALVDRNAVLARILASRSWRMTRALRFGGRVLRGEWPLVLAGLRQAPLWVRKVRKSGRVT